MSATFSCYDNEEGTLGYHNSDMHVLKSILLELSAAQDSLRQKASLVSMS